MGKSLKNVVTPDEIFEQYGADTLRLYEMFTGPLDQSRPWDSTAIVGMYRLLQRIWRIVVDEERRHRPGVGLARPTETLRVLHRTIASVRDGMEGLRSNTSIARITELTNHLTATYPDGGVPRPVAEALVLLLAPLAPHTAEELWSRLGHAETVTYAALPRGRPGVAGGRRRRAARPGQRQGPGPDHGADRRRPGRRRGRRPRRRGRPARTAPPSARSSSSPAAWSASSSPSPWA